MSSKNYLAMVRPEEGDREDSGVKGMKWGVRRNRAQLKAAAAKRASEPDHIKKAASKPAGAETSSARYARLQAEARAGKGKDMSDEDLKFFNARTDALKKVEALNAQKPGWLAETSKRVLLSVAEEQMKSIASNVANKHISGPINKSVNKATTKS